MQNHNVIPRTLIGIARFKYSAKFGATGAFIRCCRPATLVEGLTCFNKINIAVLRLSNPTPKYLPKINKIYPTYSEKRYGQEWS